MSEWQPATEVEAAMQEALRAGDQELYFRILARAELLLPVSADALAGRSPVGWGTWTTGGRTHVLAFTSSEAMQACLADNAGSARRLPYFELAASWPNLEWWLAVNPGLPIEGYLPAWFVSQLSRGDVRLPGRTMGARARLERAESVARARATAVVPGQIVQPAPDAPSSRAERLGRMARVADQAAARRPTTIEGTATVHPPEPLPRAAAALPPAALPPGPPPATAEGVARGVSPVSPAAAQSWSPAGPETGRATVPPPPAVQHPTDGGLTSRLGAVPSVPPATGRFGAPTTESVLAPPVISPTSPGRASVPPGSFVRPPYEPSAPYGAPTDEVTAPRGPFPPAGPFAPPRPGDDAPGHPGPGSSRPGDELSGHAGVAPSRPGDEYPGPAPSRPGDELSGHAGVAPWRPGDDLPGHPGVAPLRPGDDLPGHAGVAPSRPGDEYPGHAPSRPGDDLPGHPGAEPAAYTGSTAAAPTRPAGPAGHPDAEPAGDNPDVHGAPAPSDARQTATAPIEGPPAGPTSWPDSGPLPAEPTSQPYPTQSEANPNPNQHPAEPEPAAEAEPEPPAVAFEPANDVEESLLAAAGDGSTDAFLSTLLLARVLLPAAPDSKAGTKPGADGFVWRTESLDGEPYVVVFTSKERMLDHLDEANAQDTLSVKFVQLINRWPDESWSFAVNPGTPVGAKLPGAQIVALASWAAEVGLGADDPEEPMAGHTGEMSTPRPAETKQEHARPTMMQKTIAPSQVDYYLDRGYDRVSGFVHRATEVAHLKTPGQLYAALGLGYPDSPFAADASEVFVLRWPAYRPSLYRIPYGGQNETAMRAMEGWVIERAPFRGNGFAPGDTSDVIAEFKVDSARLPHGAQLWRVKVDGAEELVATLDSDAPMWRKES